MDFVSSHHGAVPGNAMVSPGQFTHPLMMPAPRPKSLPQHWPTTLCLRTTSRPKSATPQVVGNDAARAHRREFGFLRMWSIHPNQIRPIVEAMQPDYSEVEMASEIICALHKMPTGVRSSTPASCTTAPPSAITGSCCSAPRPPAWPCPSLRASASFTA